MNTDAAAAESAELAAALEKAAALIKENKPEKVAAVLKKHGLEHATDKLLAPEPPKNGAHKRVRTATKLKSARKVKAKTKTAKAKHKAVSGQSGPTIKGLKWDDLNKKEKLLLGCFDLEGEREIRTIEQLGGEAFKSQTKKVQNSWSRNSLRRLVRSDPAWLEKTEPGKYRMTQHARTALRS